MVGSSFQHAAEGIRANAVHPGVIETVMTDRMLMTDTGRQCVIERYPLGRLGRRKMLLMGCCI